jgi:hypothetical protein
MNYSITRLAGGQHISVSITEEEFARVKKAKVNYLIIIGIEEKLDLLLENYVEFESGLLSLSLRRAVFSDFDWGGLMDDIQATNRRLANLLMSIRLYTDQVKRSASALFGRNGETTVALLKDLEEQRGNSLGLRVLEELRNHIQHRDLPIQHLTHNRARSDSATGVKIRHSVKPALLIASLKEDPRFDRHVLRDLEEKGGTTVAVVPFVREGIEAICQVHQRLRTLADSATASWCNILQDVLARGREILGEDLTALGVVAEDDEERCVESEQVFAELLQRRGVLLKKNSNLSRLSLRFVSGGEGD